MSNRRYYERRAANLCPDCGVAVLRVGVYCDDHRRARNARVQADRELDRSGYNLYMRVFKSETRRRRQTA